MFSHGKPIFEIAKPDLVVRVYPGLLEVELKHISALVSLGAKQQVSKRERQLLKRRSTKNLTHGRVMDVNPMLKSGFGKLFQWNSPTAVPLWEISSTQIDERGYLIITVPSRGDLSIALGREESTELKGFLDPLIQGEQTRRLSLQRARDQALKELQRRPTFPIVFAILSTMSVVLILASYSLGVVVIARLLGWTGIAVMGVVVISGFNKMYDDKRFMTQLRNPPLRPSKLAAYDEYVAEKYYDSRIRGWKKTHTLLAIFATAVAGVHGLVLFPMLGRYASTAIFYPPGFSGPPSYIFLLAVGITGAYMLAKFKTPIYGKIKKLHFWLMVLAFTMAELHIINVGSTIGRMGYTLGLALLLATALSIGVTALYSLVRPHLH